MRTRVRDWDLAGGRSTLTLGAIVKTTIIVAAVAACVVALAAFFARARAQQPRKADPQVYVELRNQALSVSRGAIGLPLSKPTAPAAVLMDSAFDDFTLTTVAIPDGTASIYLSNGGGFIGGGQRYESIRSAALDMVRAAEASLASMTLVKGHPLPPPGHTSFYVVTESGVYSATVTTAKVGSAQHPLYSLYAAAQNVLTQYRLSQTTK
jgi:hypothetical protein